MKLEISGKIYYIPHLPVPTVWCMCVCAGEDGDIKFKSIAPLVAKENGYLSRASFRDICLSPRKLYPFFEIAPLTPP